MENVYVNVVVDQVEVWFLLDGVSVRVWDEGCGGYVSKGVPPAIKAPVAELASAVAASLSDAGSELPKHRRSAKTSRNDLMAHAARCREALERLNMAIDSMTHAAVCKLATDDDC